MSFPRGWRALAAAFALTFTALPAMAQTTAPATFTTLGTGSGPMGNPKRAQPAHLLRAGEQTILIDAGDGATEQIVKAGVPFGEVQTILISHLHTDHIGGLFAFIGRRYQVSTRGFVTIYGPVGTKALVAGFIASLEPVLASWPKGRRAIPPARQCASSRSATAGPARSAVFRFAPWRTLIMR